MIADPSRPPPSEPDAVKSESNSNRGTPSARLGAALRLGLRESWDRLGLVIAVSLTWTLLFSLPLGLVSALPPTLPGAIRLLVLLASAVCLLAPAAAGAFTAAHLAYAREEVSYLDFWRGARRLLWPALGIGLVNAAAFVLLAINIWFYLNLKSLVGGLAVLICLYICCFWGMMAVHHFPLLAAQEAGVFDEPERQAKRGVRAVLRRAFYLALGDPFYTLGLLVVVLALSALMAVVAVPFVLLWAGTMAFVTTQATRALLIKYEVLPAPPVEEVVPDEKFRIK